jgi:hypothetical protein
MNDFADVGGCDAGLFKSPKRETKESFLARMSETLINSESEE